MVRRISFTTLCITLGFLMGMILTGRLRTADESSAAEQTSASAPKTAAAPASAPAAALPDPRNTALFVGYQAEGTRGRLLVDGARSVRLKGHDVAVAARVEKLDSMSAHADAGEIMQWLSGFSRAPSMTYLVHGEEVALEALRARIEAERHWPVHVAGYEEKVEI